jgi:hypothetical protein
MQPLRVWYRRSMQLFVVVMISQRTEYLHGSDDRIHGSQLIERHESNCNGGNYDVHDDCDKDCENSSARNILQLMSCFAWLCCNWIESHVGKKDVLSAFQNSKQTIPTLWNWTINRTLLSNPLMIVSILTVSWRNERSVILFSDIKYTDRNIDEENGNFQNH